MQKSTSLQRSRSHTPASSLGRQAWLWLVYSRGAGLLANPQRSVSRGRAEFLIRDTDIGLISAFLESVVVSHSFKNLLRQKPAQTEVKKSKFSSVEHVVCGHVVKLCFFVYCERYKAGFCSAFE